MERDIRQTLLYREVQALCYRLRRVGTGQISDASEIHVSPNGRYAVFSGAIMADLEGIAPTRICQVELMSGETRVLTFGPNVDRSPKFCPDGLRVAFLSDRLAGGNFQLYFLDWPDACVHAAPVVEGWVEYLHWSPDGRRLLLGVAGHGADLPAGVTGRPICDPRPSWMPAISAEAEGFRWRRAWVYELATNTVRPVTPVSMNVWEASWCGDQALAVITSPGPGEGLWYTAGLQLVEVSSGSTRVLLRPRDQIGVLSGSPLGNQIAVVEGLCSDRGYVAGDLWLLETATGECRWIDTCGVDVTYAEWRAERRLLIAGHRGAETVIGILESDSSTFTELWRSKDLSTGGRYVTVAGLGDAGDCVLVAEGFVRPPEIGIIRNGAYQFLKNLSDDQATLPDLVKAAECITWAGRDGLKIQGWLLLPQAASPPYPLVMYVHGGPVWHWRPLWLGRWTLFVLVLLRLGYAIFLPNPSGSSGRGQEFARRVLGDMGGADTHDYLCGIDHLVNQGIADPGRLGVVGNSYGGFMTSWLVTQDSRFAAAVAVSPHVNHVTEHLLSNIPHFTASFLADKYTNSRGRYFERSPIMYAHKSRTPMLSISGALDRCTPWEEAAQFHRALLENCTESALVVYPKEWHGVRQFPAAIDYATRVVAWFEAHLRTGHERHP